MNTANALAVGIIILAIVAVLAHGQGSVTMIDAIAKSIAWASNMVNSIGQNSQSAAS